MQRSSVRRIALPLAALAALPIVVSEAQLDQIEAHKACKHIENTNCHGPCIYWYMSDAPWNDEELIRRANTCFGNGESWEGYTQSIENAEEVVVTGTPVPTVVIRPTPRPIPHTCCNPDTADTYLWWDRNDCTETAIRYRFVADRCNREGHLHVECSCKGRRQHQYVHV